MDDHMTAKEMSRLSEWLLSYGCTARETLECLQYIAGALKLPENERKKVTPPNTTESVT